MTGLYSAHVRGSERLTTRLSELEGLGLAERVSVLDCQSMMVSGALDFLPSIKPSIFGPSEGVAW